MVVLVFLYDFFCLLKMEFVMGSRLRTLYMHQGITYLLSGNFTSCRSCEGYSLCISSINGKSVVYVIFFAVCFFAILFLYYIICIIVFSFFGGK